MRWQQNWIGEGTTVERFVGFIEHIINELEQRHPGQSFVFKMGIFNVHHNAGVVNLILDSGHRLVSRAPHWAVDGAIEYVFNKLYNGGSYFIYLMRR